MIMRATVIVNFVLLLIVSANSQLPVNPCPNVFQYSFSGNQNIGIITVNDVTFGQTKVEIQMSQPGNLQSNYPGQLSLNFNKDKIVEYINNRSPMTFRVDFPQPNVVPQVVSITVNDFQLCSGPEVPFPSSKIKLYYNLSASSGFQQIIPNANTRNPSWSDFNSQYQQNSNQQQFNQISFTQPPNNQQSLNQPIPNQQSFNQPTGHEHTVNLMRTLYRNNMNQPAYSQPTLNQPAFNQQQSFNQPSMQKETLNFVEELNRQRLNNPESTQATFYPTAFNPLSAQFDLNPQNPFLNNANDANDYRPPAEYGPRNPPPTTPKTTQFITPSLVSGFDTRNNPTPSTAANLPKDQVSFEYINSVCGQENLNVDFTQLNINGQVVARSRFPWIVAIFRKANSGLKFHCGGSLISTKSVVSAAHCFYIGVAFLQPEEIVVSVGRHSLIDQSEGFNMEVENVIRHPEYKPELINFDADVAIVNLRESVRFTLAVRPVCMWQGPSDPRSIEGVSGIIVGWGADGRSNTTTVPTLVDTTVVSEVDCIRSNEHFVSLTSNRTLCAGSPNRNSGPCIGDSGNGLMIKKRNKWMLRGSVSASFGTPDGQCNVENYAIYSDIAMFVDWIRSNMWL